MRRSFFFTLLLSFGYLSLATSTQPINQGSTVTSPIIIPFIRINDAGIALASWVNRESTNNIVRSSYSSDFGMTWSPPAQLTPSGFSSFSSSARLTSPLPLNSHGKSVLAWINQDTTTMTKTLVASFFSSDSGWGPLSNIAFFPTLNDSSISISSFVIGNNNTAVVAWKELSGSDLDMKCSYTTNGGMTWTSHTLTTVTPLSVQEPTAPAIAMNPAGNFLIFYWAEEVTLGNWSVKTIFSDLTTWGSPQELGQCGDEAKDDNFAIVVNDAQDAIGVWIEKVSSNQGDLKGKVKTGSSWGSESLFDTSMSFFAPPLFAVSINQQGHAALTWSNKTNATTFESKGSFYNGSAWTAAQLLGTISIPSGGSGDFLHNTVINNADTCLAGFIFPDGPFVVTSYSPSSMMWQSAEILDPVTAGVGSLVSLNEQNKGLAAWISVMGNPQQFSTKAAKFSSGVWSVQDVPNSTSIPNPNFFLPPWGGITSDNKTLIGWGQEGSTLIQVATLSSGPDAPTGGSGFQTQTEFLVPTDLINVLSWQPSTTANVSYRIYRNGILIGTSDKPSYDDHQRIQGETVTYSVTAVDASGNQSSPILFTVRP